MINAARKSVVGDSNDPLNLSRRGPDDIFHVSDVRRHLFKCAEEIRLINLIDLTEMVA